MTSAEAFETLIATIKSFEGCSLRAYPDPASPLGRAMLKAGLLARYMRGEAEVPESLQHLPGAPWTIGYGETNGVKENDLWTPAQADTRLRARVTGVMSGVLRKCPRLRLEPPERLIACTDLAYNIGLGAFDASSVCRHTNRGEFAAAADSFLLWNKAGGRVMKGLTVRRQWDRLTYLSG